MRKSFVTFVSVLAVASPASSNPLPLQPTGKWIVNFAEARCVASRNYGTEDRPLFLVLKEPAHRSVIQLSLVQKGTSAPPEQVPVTIEFDDGPKVKTTMMSFYSDTMHLRAFQVNVPIDQFAAGMNAGTVRIDGKWLNERLVLSNLPALMRTMDKCVADLREYWNVVDQPASAPDKDEAVRGSGSWAGRPASAQADLGAYVSGDDYPWAALVRSQGGAVKFSLLIDEQGKVADCSVIETSGIASLDAQSCALLTERARFTPAIAPDGKPARDSVIGRIRWVVP